ncbi:FimV family protein [Pseudomonadota bacterium]
MKNYRYLIVTAALLSLFSTEVLAFELGKISVASHLSEPFRAELPLTLDEGETLTQLSVELAAPAEYRDLGIYRDPAIGLIRTDLSRVDRGGLIELSSRYPVDAPVLVILLKIRYGHATHFRKFSLFLDISRTAGPAKAATVQEPEETPLTMGEDSEVATEIEVETRAPFKPFDGWARTSRYGPVIYGDSIFTIADRLRIDKRYTIRQIMVALFEKNRARFAEDNLNFPLQGAYLATPAAAEVEKRSYEQALSFIEEHYLHWRELVKQARYAAIAEAQRTRYSKRKRDVEDVQAARDSPAWIESGDLK